MADDPTARLTDYQRQLLTDAHNAVAALQRAVVPDRLLPMVLQAIADRAGLLKENESLRQQLRRSAPLARVGAPQPQEEDADAVLRWLAGLEANARTVNDDEGVPLAEKCVQARALIQRLLAARVGVPHEEPPQWQPIETAPKDGHALCVWSGDWRSIVDLRTLPLMKPAPTHWLPLPAPPAVKPAPRLPDQVG